MPKYGNTYHHPLPKFRRPKDPRALTEALCGYQVSNYRIVMADQRDTTTCPSCKRILNIINKWPEDWK